MSGIYLPGAEVPSACIYCDIPVRVLPCPVDHGSVDRYTASIHPDCPIVPVDEHGRLGDLDELEERIRAWISMYARAMSESEKTYVTAVLKGIQATPTIIPADKEGRNVTDHKELAKLFPKRKRKPVTNYDRLISKTPEEMAEWLRSIISECSRCPCAETEKICEKPCKEILLDWLNSPV